MVNLFQKHKLLFLIASGLFILAIIIALTNYSQSRTDDSNQELDTPSLINQAFARGEITKEERLLYLAYAVFEPESLPTRYRGNIGWFGEATVQELQESLTPPEVVCSMSSRVRSEFIRLFNLGPICD